MHETVFYVVLSASRILPRFFFLFFFSLISLAKEEKHVCHIKTGQENKGKWRLPYTEAEISLFWWTHSTFQEEHFIILNHGGWGGSEAATLSDCSKTSTLQSMYPIIVITIYYSSIFFVLQVIGYFFPPLLVWLWNLFSPST